MLSTFQHPWDFCRQPQERSIRAIKHYLQIFRRPSSMSHPTLKLVLLICAPCVYYISITPPNPLPTRRDKLYKGQLFEQIVRRLSFISRIAVLTAFVCEALVIISLSFPSYIPESVQPALCPRGISDPALLLSITPSFSLGFALSMLATFVRVCCFKELGTLFTFEVTVRPGHKLVTTGPYAYVRHPSYTGTFLNISGVVIMHFAPGGWNRACGIMRTAGGGGMVGTYLFLSVFSIVSLWKRASVEDAQMRETFGEKWVEYRRAVPYRFFWGLF